MGTGAKGKRWPSSAPGHTPKCLPSLLSAEARMKAISYGRPLTRAGVVMGMGQYPLQCLAVVVLRFASSFIVTRIPNPAPNP